MEQVLVIGVAATKTFLHVWPTCIRGIAQAASHYREAHFIFATDRSKESNEAEELAKKLLPEGWKIVCIRFDMPQDDKDYNEQAQLRIAMLQGALFDYARSKVRADLFWSVESDTIVPANALRVLEWTLQMPQADGTPVYDIAAALYNNGLFLCGFGTEENPIAEDFLPEERVLTERAKKYRDKLDELNKTLPTLPPEQADKTIKRMQRFSSRWVKKFPPDGNIWQVTAKHGWRRRGWFDYAYPGIGEGAIVPSNWCGLGCTLLSKKALAVSDFVGYEGKGTQDLFLCWKRWQNQGMRIAAVPHVLCDHIKRDGDKIVHLHAWHEPKGPHKGHIRLTRKPWVPV